MRLSFWLNTSIAITPESKLAAAFDDFHFVFGQTVETIDDLVNQFVGETNLRF
jgi:hypothetical protein